MIQTTMYAMIQKFPGVFKPYIPLLISFQLFLTFSAGLRRIMIPPMPNRIVDTIKKLVEWTNISVLLTILIIHLGDSHLETNFYYLFLIVPFINALPFLLINLWS